MTEVPEEVERDGIWIYKEIGIKRIFFENEGKEVKIGSEVCKEKAI